MSEEKKNDIFSKRTNQFSSLKNKNKEQNIDTTSFEEKEFIEKENVIDDIVNEDISSNSEEHSAPTGSLLDQFLEDTDNQEDSLEIDNQEIEDYTVDTSDFTEDDYNNDTSDFEDIDVGDEFEDASDELSISIEDDEPEDDSDDSMMTNMLDELDSELNKQSLQAQNNMLEEFEEEIEDSSDENSETEEFNDYYTSSEINEKKIKPGINTKDLLIKVGVGVVAVVVIILLAVFISKGINKGLNSSGTNNPQPPESQTNETPSTNTNTIVDDIIGDMTSDTVDEVPDNSSEDSVIETPEDDSFVKNYKGYIVDIKDDSVILSDLPYNKYLFLIEAFKEFTMKNPEEVKVRLDESTGKYHHEFCNCQNLPTELSVITLKTANENSYEAETCALTVGVDDLVDPKDFDYESYPELRGIVFTRIAITEDSNISLSNFTIGVQATATYFQDTESFLNELIELKPAKQSVDTSPDEGVDPETGKPTDKPSTGNNSGVNVWGEEWNNIVTNINDRREEENKDNTTDNNGNQIELGKTEKYESVSTSLEIGAASIVWFKISWKANADVSSVPDAEDVTVELLTPNGSLINSENIDKYGKLWVDEATGIVNIVLRNTQAGTYDIVFTKSVGTYLGDVTINAIPITGFIELAAADAVYTNGKLEVIWNAIGVVDDNCLVEVYAVNGKKKVLLYSANSLDDGIHTVDMASINVSKIAGNTYDIIIRVTDIDISANKPYTISAKYLSDSITIPNVEIPQIKN